MHERSVCTSVNDRGQDCDQLVPDGAPVTLCLKHMIRAYLFVRDRLTVVPPMDRACERAKFDTKVVYYVRFGDRVKIGTTADLVTRLQGIPHDEVLAVEPGGVELERGRHNEFAEHHIRGEWFHAHPHLLAHAMRDRIAHPELLPSN